VAGGADRQTSVHAGLRASDAASAWVLVHDAARPLIRAGNIRDCLAALAQHPAVVLAVPLADTLKRADADGAISATVDRHGLWQAQTPQMFRIGLLRDALMAAESAGVSVTDEASAVESLGYAPRLVRGDMENLKVTFPPDFALAARLLRTR
jgi:2-C-methyl-D-erythritol 4-phosphate cytidylyltransferase